MNTETSKLISIMLPNLGGGGVERVRILLAEEFLARGYAVEFVLLNAVGELLPEVPAGASVIDLKARRYRNALRPLVSYLRARKPAALLAAMWPLTGLAVLAKKISRSNCRLVVSEHNRLSKLPTIGKFEDILHRRFGRLIYAQANAVITVSQGVKDDLIERTRLPEGSVNVVYNPVRKIKADSFADKSIIDWWKNSKYALIAIGSFKEGKDYPNLIKAISQLPPLIDVNLLILGDGMLRADLEDLIDDLGVKDRVLMPGFVADPYPYLAHADLFVLSSAWEGLGNVLIEALVAGVPVVATDCESGPAEILENGKFGRLVPVNDAGALAEAITIALGEAPNPAVLQRRGREFSINRAADQYLSLISV